MAGDSSGLGVVDGTLKPGLSDYEDEQLMEGFDGTQYKEYFPRFSSMDKSRGTNDKSMVLAAMAPIARPITVKTPNREIDINLSRVSLALANEALF